MTERSKDSLCVMSGYGSPDLFLSLQKTVSLMMHEKALIYEYSKIALGVTLSLHVLLFLGKCYLFLP